MAGLAKEFEQLDCWESATEEENIVIYGMDFEDEKVFIVFTDDMGKTPVDAKASLVAACYSEDVYKRQVIHFFGSGVIC